MVSWTSWCERKVLSKLVLRISHHNLTDCSEERVRKGAEKLSKGMNVKQQGRLDSFFTVKAKEAPAGKGKGKAPAKGTKRKVGSI